MAGLRSIKENKSSLKSIFGLINNLVSQYKLALQQTYNEFKKNAEVSVQQAAHNTGPQRGDQ